MAAGETLEERDKKVFASERREDIFALIVAFIVWVLAMAGIWKYGTLKALIFV
ncbi:hypothetical protein [Candidatus Pyrohabitans sp.]